MTDEHEDLAPSDSEWHRQYARTMQEIQCQLAELNNSPLAHDGEDLTDYTEMLVTLLSFRPSTRDDFEREARALVTWGHTCSDPNVHYIGGGVGHKCLSCGAINLEAKPAG